MDASLAAIYRQYIDCLNARDMANLGRFVHEQAEHNDRAIGLEGYRAMLQNDVRMIPDLQYEIVLEIVQDRWLAARLAFDCTPAGEFLGLPVNGRRVVFTENVFYEFDEGKIRRVWSLVDKAAIEAQLAN